MAERERWDGWLGPKQWMPIVGVLSVAVIALAIALVLNLNDDSDTGGVDSTAGRVPAHEHADFLLFIRGEQFDFNQPQFISHADGTELSDHVHIHEPHYTVVHSHLSGTTWDEFFTSLGFTLNDPSFPGIDAARTCMTLPEKTKLCDTATETWKFIANGVPVDGLANVNISDLSRVVFSYGPETVDQVLAQQWTKITDEACILSELCMARVDPNAPPEECQGKGVCSK
ncbi:MAG: hypothetical protein AB7J35_18890 [Dehalococcoidia bacterium]